MILRILSSGETGFKYDFKFPNKYQCRWSVCAEISKISLRLQSLVSDISSALLSVGRLRGDIMQAVFSVEGAFFLLFISINIKPCAYNQRHGHLPFIRCETFSARSLRSFRAAELLLLPLPPWRKEPRLMSIQGHKLCRYNNMLTAPSYSSDLITSLSSLRSLALSQPAALKDSKQTTVASGQLSLLTAFIHFSFNKISV